MRKIQQILIDPDSDNKDGFLIVLFENGEMYRGDYNNHWQKVELPKAA